MPDTAEQCAHARVPAGPHGNGRPIPSIPSHHDLHRGDTKPADHRHRHSYFGFADDTAAGWSAVALLTAFAVQAALVVSGWPPLMAADQHIVETLTGVASAGPWLIDALTWLTDLGGSGFAWLALTVAVIWLLIRRERALALYVASAGLGSAALVTGVKALADRPRPVLDEPIAAAPGLSFPSGHSLGSTVTYGVLLLVFVPIAPARWHRVIIAATAALVGLIGITRILLGVHFPSDVLGGWLLGAFWVLVTAIAFRSWHRSAGLGSPPLSAGLEPEERHRLLPAPAHDHALPGDRPSVAALLVAAVLLWGAVVGVGLLITGALPAVRSFDSAVSEWFAGFRSEELTDIFFAVSRIGDTPSIMLGLLAAIALAAALTRRRRPAVFLLAGVFGEVLLFLAISQVVGRSRPEVEHLTPGLPPTSSFPSGHVGATTALYGGIAVLVVLWWKSPLRHLALVLAFVIAAAVAVARLYIGVHYLTDATVSIVYTSCWLAICAWAIQPGPDGAAATQVRREQPEEHQKGKVSRQ